MFNTEEFMWKHFEKFHTDFDEPGQERFNPQRFKREYTNWRFSDMPGKIVTLKKDTELPTGSLLHLCDNFAHPDYHSDTPVVASNPFVERESFKKFIYHIHDFDLDSPIHLEDKFIYRQAGLPTQFMKFRATYGSQFRYINKIEEIPTKKECLPIINHNPLFRARVMGRLQFFRKTELILTSILNTCCKLAFLNKQQWILFPWGDDVYERAMFIRTRTALTPATLKRPDSFQWLLQMHLLNFMWNDATTSIFSKIPEDVLPQINLILDHNEKYVFYNLQILKDMNVKNKAYIKFSNQLNLLSILGRIHPDQESSKVKELIAQAIEKVGIVKEDLTAHEDTPVEEVYEELTEQKEQDTAVEETTDKVEEGIKHLNRAVPRPVALPAIPKVSKEVVTPPDEPKHFQKVSPTAKVTALVPNNVTHIKEIESDSRQISEDYYRDMTRETEEYILNREELTPAQKQRYLKVSKKWEEVTLNGVPLKEIMLKDNDLTLDHESIPEEVVGPIPDKSALKSSLSAFDRDYMAKTYHKQLAGVLTSFQKNGIFLIGIKEEKVVSEMNNYTRYSVQYEDIEGKRSTIRFQIPSVNRRGRVRIDGVTQVLKKQKINLPIVKINDCIVSLSSCQNKTRVERNTNKAHNYFSYIESIVNSPKTTVAVEYGKSIVNLPLSYEYASIGERYKTLSFKNGTDKWELYFDYETRLEHFKDKEEVLLGLEKEYGTYFGRNNDSWFFVDSLNQVHAVRMQGGENHEVSQWDSIAGIIKLSVNEGESLDKVLTEWCNIKILDAYLPVIFLLGYKFGLRNVLDELGVQYTVTERRSKVIVGEGNLAAQEGYDLYHQTAYPESVKKYGLCSPRGLYEINPKLFHEASYDRYAWRAAEWMKKNLTQITDEDVLEYLDKGRPPSTSRDIFFAFLPLKDMPFVRIDKQEYSIPLDTIKKYSLGDPIIFLGKKLTKTTWSKLKADIEKYRKDAAKGAAKDPSGHFAYKYIVHMAAPCRNIPYKDLNPIDKEIPGQEGWNIFEDKSPLNIFFLCERNFDKPDVKVLGILLKRSQMKRTQIDVLLTLPTPEKISLAAITDNDPKDAEIKKKRTKLLSYLTALTNIPADRIRTYSAWVKDPKKPVSRCVPSGTAKIYTLDQWKKELQKHPGKPCNSFESYELVMDPFEHEEMFGANINNVSSGTDEVIDGVDWIKIAGQEAANALTYIPGVEDAGKSNVEIKVKDPKALDKTSLKIPYPPHLSTNKINGLDQLRALGIPNDQYAVGASASMILYDIKKDPNRDLDVGISPEWLAKLEERGLIDLVEEDSGLHKVLKGSTEKGCEIDFGVFNPDGTPNMPWDEHHSGLVIVDGVTFDNVYEMFRFYTWLLHHAKNEFFVEKRTRQLRELSEAVSNWFGHVCYHGSALQGIPYMQARIASSYKNRGPLVFASYFKHFAMTFGYKWNDDIFKHGWTIAADGLTPIITMEFKKDIEESALRAPYSIYKLPDAGFRHLLRSEEDPDNFGGHPITEIIHSGDVQIESEEYREDWLEDMFSLEKIGLLKLEGKERIIKPKIHGPIQGLTKKVDDGIFDDISVQLDTEVTDATAPQLKDTGIRFVPKETSIPIKFADRILWIDRYPLAHSFIIAGLDNYDLSNYEMGEFESPDVYYSLLQDKNMSINYLKGIDIFFESFMDPITYTTLKMMHEPTTVRELLIRAVQLLTTLDHLPTSSSKNFKVRGYEQFVAILYNEMARQYATYRKGRGKNNVFSIPEEAVYLRILQNSSMLTSEPGSPLKDFTENAYLTHLGIGGRTGESFVVVDRKMARDDTGIMSETSPVNGNVGVNSQLTYDPSISNTLGILDPKPIPELSPANAFSLYGLLFPWSTSDDPARLNFVATQSEHLVPTKYVERNRVRTGYERVLAHHVGREFAGIAEQDGVVTSVNEKTKMIEVKYKDGTKDIFPYGSIYVAFEGFNVDQDVVNLVKPGQKLKKGDVLTYNKGYFTYDKYSGQLDYSTGVIATVAVMEMDISLEDSNIISTRLADKLTMFPVNMRTVVLSKKSLIHSCATVGQHVKNTEPLMIFEEQEVEKGQITNDEETLALLSDLNRSTPSAKYTGKIVQIQALAGCPMEEMSPTLRAIFKQCIEVQNLRSKQAKGTDSEDDYPPNGILPKGTKYKGVTFDDDTVCLMFYIQEDMGIGNGDKVIWGNQCKSTVADLMPMPYYSLSGIELDAIFSAAGIGRRMVLSPVLTGILSRVIARIEQHALNIYFNEKS